VIGREKGLKQEKAILEEERGNYCIEINTNNNF
jgi:hypothetical protein